MRFTSRPPADYPPISSGVRRRLWALVALLGAVGWMMQHLQQPETVERLGRAFQLAPPPARDTPDDPDLLDRSSLGDFVQGPGAQPQSRIAADAVAAVAPDRGAVEPASHSPLAAGDDDAARPPAADAAARPLAADDAARPPAADVAAAWAAVTDNAYFLPQEQAAWWALWARALSLRDTDAAAQPWPASLGEISYVQLLQQPEAYRGRLVTVRGTAIRCEATRPAANALGLERLDRVWIAPVGGGDRPIVVYFAGLEPEFPRGATIRVPLTVDGFFFKVWSYAHEEGLGLAPALVAAQWTWKSPALRAERVAAAQPLPWGWIFSGALALAGCAVGWAVWTTSRPRSTHRVAPLDPAVWADLDHDQAESGAPHAAESLPEAKPQLGDGQQ